MDLPLWQSLGHNCLAAICLGSLRVGRKLILSYSRKQPPSAVSTVTLLPCVQSMLSPLRITLLLSEQEKKGLAGWSRAWVRGGLKKCKAVKSSVYGLDKLAGRRSMVQWSGVCSPRIHEGPGGPESLCVCWAVQKDGDNFGSEGLRLAAGSLNFRGANRTPSVCALVERPQHWLAPGEQ